LSSPSTNSFPAEPVQRQPAFRIPPVTGWLIALNVLVQIVRHFLPANLDETLVDLFGFDAASLHRNVDGLSFLSLITYQFLHQGWDHLTINMVSLLAFGAGIERPLGAKRYLALYLVCGIAGALLESLFTVPSQDDVLVGASASISGVFGALMIIRSLYRAGRRPMGIVPMALIWVGLLAITGKLGVGAGGAQVAWIAHIGGFIAGILFGLAYRRTVRPA
jgi:membrane associated rhomboid family serine protease